MKPAFGLFTMPCGFWVVVHRLHVPRCPLAGKFDWLGVLEGRRA